MGKKDWKEEMIVNTWDLVGTVDSHSLFFFIIFYRFVGKFDLLITSA